MFEYLLEQFIREIEVEFQGETYLVRDNGAICRRQRPNKYKRPLDNKWTFGNPSESDGYMKICGIAVHRVVASAFHGVAPSKEYIVDHIDTNRRNNQPENLRWITRLENITKNPRTLRRIEKKYGSIENLLNKSKDEPLPKSDFSYMGPVEKFIPFDTEAIFDSLTPLAGQRNWKTPTEFPSCPEKISANPLHNYAARLECGTIFSCNRYGKSVVEIAELNKIGTCLSVLCITDSGVKNYALSKITFEEGKFIHAGKGTFFDHNGAEKSHCQLIGKVWEEPEGYEWCIDDYC